MRFLIEFILNLLIYKLKAINYIICTMYLYISYTSETNFFLGKYSFTILIDHFKYNARSEMIQICQNKI